MTLTPDEPKEPWKTPAGALATVADFAQLGRQCGDDDGAYLVERLTAVGPEHWDGLMKSLRSTMLERARKLDEEGIATDEMMQAFTGAHEAAVSQHLDAWHVARMAQLGDRHAEARGYQFGAAAADELATMLKSGTPQATLEAFWKGAQAGAAKRTEALIADAVRVNRPPTRP
jgi:hypothetical protein